MVGKMEKKNFEYQFSIFKVLFINLSAQSYFEGTFPSMYPFSRFHLHNLIILQSYNHV